MLLYNHTVVSPGERHNNHKLMVLDNRTSYPDVFDFDKISLDELYKIIHKEIVAHCKQFSVENEKSCRIAIYSDEYYPQLSIHHHRLETDAEFNKRIKYNNYLDAQIIKREEQAKKKNDISLAFAEKQVKKYQKIINESKIKA